MSADPIQAVSALDEPVRRRLYELVAASREAVSRDEAAAAAGIGRPLAAFHLDRLAEQGLLSVEYRRLTGRTGRGAGRPSKLYRRAEREFSVQLPPRSYALAGDLMAEAIEDLGSSATDALDRAAHARGLELGRSVAASARDGDANPATGEPGAPGTTQIEDAAGALARLGYEPLLSADGELRLGNCPFHELAAAHREATCGMNLAMVQGVLDGLGTPGLVPRMDPEPGWCCVRISAAEAARPGV